MSFKANQGTQTDILTTQIGGTETGVVRLDVGVGTTIVDFGGTIRDVANLAKGTITELGSATAIGQIHNAGTIAELPTLPGGTINVGTVTIDAINDQVAIMATDTGDIKSSAPVGDASDLPGTINKLHTQSILHIYNGATYDRLRGDTTGVFVGNLAQGTITALALGTMKLLATPAGSSVLSHGTLGTAGGSFFATISALSGAGTRHYVTNVDVVMQSGTADVRVLAGTGIQGTGVIAAGQFPAGGGIAKHFAPPFDAGANSILAYHFVGAGTAFITVNYFKAV